MLICYKNKPVADAANQKEHDYIAQLFSLYYFNYKLYKNISTKLFMLMRCIIYHKHIHLR
jgi:hypothetical protein